MVCKSTFAYLTVMLLCTASIFALPTTNTKRGDHEPTLDIEVHGQTTHQLETRKSPSKVKTQKSNPLPKPKPLKAKPAHIAKPPKGKPSPKATVHTKPTPKTKTKPDPKHKAPATKPLSGPKAKNPTKETAATKTKSPAKKPSSKPPSKTSPSKQPKASQSASCPLPATKGSGTKNKGKIHARGCASSKEDLKANQIKLKDSKKKDVIFTIGSRLGVGANGEAFNVVGQTSLVAKHFKASASGPEIQREENNLKTLKKLRASGSSTLGPDGAATSWVVVPKVDGKPLTKVQDFHSKMAGPKAACEKYLDDRYNDLANGIEEMQRESGLIHSDPNDGNVHWTDSSRFVGLLDFGAMVTTAGFAAFIQDSARLNAGKFGGITTVRQFAIAEGNSNWPKSGCKGA